MADETFEQQIAAALSAPYQPFSPLSDDEVKRAVTAIQEELGEWSSDRLHAQWARWLAEQNYAPRVAAAIQAALPLGAGIPGWNDMRDGFKNEALIALRGPDA